MEEDTIELIYNNTYIKSLKAFIFSNSYKSKVIQEISKRRVKVCL